MRIKGKYYIQVGKYYIQRSYAIINTISFFFCADIATGYENTIHLQVWNNLFYLARKELLNNIVFFNTIKFEKH